MALWWSKVTFKILLSVKFTNVLCGQLFLIIFILIEREENAMMKFNLPQWLFLQLIFKLQICWLEKLCLQWKAVFEEQKGNTTNSLPGLKRSWIPGVQLWEQITTEFAVLKIVTFFFLQNMKSIYFLSPHLVLNIICFNSELIASRYY